MDPTRTPRAHGVRRVVDPRTGLAMPLTRQDLSPQQQPQQPQQQQPQQQQASQQQLLQLPVPRELLPQMQQQQQQQQPSVNVQRSQSLGCLPARLSRVSLNEDENMYMEGYRRASPATARRQSQPRRVAVPASPTLRRSESPQQRAVREIKETWPELEEFARVVDTVTRSTDDALHVDVRMVSCDDGDVACAGDDGRKPGESKMIFTPPYFPSPKLGFGVVGPPSQARKVTAQRSLPDDSAEITSPGWDTAPVRAFSLG